MAVTFWDFFWTFFLASKIGNVHAKDNEALLATYYNLHTAVRTIISTETDGSLARVATHRTFDHVCSCPIEKLTVLNWVKIGLEWGLWWRKPAVSQGPTAICFVRSSLLRCCLQTFVSILYSDRQGYFEAAFVLCVERCVRRVESTVRVQLRGRLLKETIRRKGQISSSATLGVCGNELSCTGTVLGKLKSCRAYRLTLH